MAVEEAGALRADQPAATFEEAVRKLLPGAAPGPRPSTLPELFAEHSSWCAEEVAVMMGITHEQALAQLQAAEKAGTLRAVHTRNGSVWHKR